MIAKHATGECAFVALGMVASTAPREALLAVLQTSCPQWHMQLVAVDTESESVPHFRVELKIDTDTPPGSINAWLHIKGALMSSFPADKPNAVATIDV